MTNPYRSLPTKAFWKSAVAERSMFDIRDLWEPKFPIRRSEQIATYGSCFAAHISAALRARGFNWLNAEPAPQGMSERNAARFNYNLFSARTGNIYTASLLKQWVEWAFDPTRVPEEIWTAAGRFYDPFRPRIEPEGFASESELRNSRAQALVSLRRSVLEARHFVFTLGLTETWMNSERGYEYQLCPGTAAGDFDPGRHAFRRMTFAQIHASLTGAISLMKKCNPQLDFILTVSPVPLVASCSGRHVLVATMESKAILRAVAAEMGRLPYVDYFPSYEMISSPVFKGAFFGPDQRSVHARGVDFVMDQFFCSLVSSEPVPRRAGGSPACDEELLAAFGG
jgi:hypothetical protein